MLEKCVLNILELNWNQRLGHKKIKLKICHHKLTSSIQMQNRSFHVIERTRTSSKCQKMTNARAKRAKILFFIDKYANCRRGCSSSLITTVAHAILSDTNKCLTVTPILQVRLFQLMRMSERKGKGKD